MRPPRAAADGVVRIVCPGRKGIHTGFLKDLSSDGLFMRILDPETPGTRLGVSFRLEGVSEVVRGEAEVAWCRASYQGPGLPPGMALRFLHLERGGDAVVARHLQRAQGGGEEAAPADAAEGAPAPAKVAEERNQEAEEDRDGAPAKAARRSVLGLVALLVAAALAVAALWWRPATPAPAETRAAAATSATAGELHTPSPPPTSPRADAAAGPVTAAPAPPRRPLQRVEGLEWEALGGVTRVLLRGDGVFPPGAVVSSRIGGDTPRLVVEVRGVAASLAGQQWEVGSEELVRIRSGFHGAGGDGDLHLVFDLPSAAVTAEIGAEDDRLSVALRLPAGE